MAAKFSHAVFRSLNSAARCCARPACFVLVGMLILANARPSQAEDWMYRRSYYSHVPANGMAPQHPLPESRSAYRTAYYLDRPTVAFSSGYRYNTNFLSVGGRTNRSWEVEGWVSYGPRGN